MYHISSAAVYNIFIYTVYSEQFLFHCHIVAAGEQCLQR